MSLFVPMFKNLLSSLFKKPYTVRYPFEKKELPRIHRGHIKIDINACIFCGICQKRCPTYALKVSKADKLWSIDRLSCITCNLCIDVCPKKCLSSGVEWSASTSNKEESIENFYATATPTPISKPAPTPE
ncbi:MAG: 4Fe-4S dicluster domain-containing protein [Oligoflexia bacterium]|nr:4Fe-4S dicluster domain-containing protein [Oligoflexia bacterium]MBF0364365.1 4Fe-4S dicluster domain-containing protein [Oligoflexia bacterium]